jgi:uncharacterized protein
MATSPFGSLFGRSPFTGLQAHMRVVHQCASHVVPLFEAMVAGDQVAMEAAAAQIDVLENEADRIKNDLRAHLPSSLFMPVDRRDLLEILHAQDSIADVAQDIAGMVRIRDMRLPLDLNDPLLALVRSSVGAVGDCLGVLERLDELLEVGFRGKQVEQVEVLLTQVAKSEDEADMLGMALTRGVFSHESDMSPVSVMLWVQMSDWIGDLSDHAQKVSNRLRLVIAR